MSCTTEGADRRLKQVIVTLGLISEIFKFDGSHIPRFEGLPRTAKLVNTELSDVFPVLELTYQHASFDVVPEGDRIPTLRLEGSMVWPCEHCLAQWDRMDYERREGKSTIATTQAE